MDVKSRWVRYLIYLIWTFFLFTIIYDLFVLPTRAIFWVGELIFAVIIYYKCKIPAWVYFSILALFLANLFGELFLGLFYILPISDKFIHLFSPLALCPFFYFMFKKKIPNKKILILFSVTLLLSCGFMWEIIEHFFDQNFHTFLQGVHLLGVETYETGPIEVMSRLDDTIYDMFFNFIGSIFFAVGALFALHKKDKKKKI